MRQRPVARRPSRLLSKCSRVVPLVEREPPTSVVKLRAEGSQIWRRRQSQDRRSQGVSSISPARRAHPHCQRKRQLARDKRAGFHGWWVASIVLGAASTPAASRLVQTCSRSAFFHADRLSGLHVFIGLIALAVIGVLARASDFVGGRRRLGVDVVSIYWHVVGGVWVIIFRLVYLLGLVA